MHITISPPQEFRKKSIVIKAIQWPGYPTEDIEKFVGKYLVSEQRDGLGVVGYFVVTLEGNSYLLATGDYIIKGIKGEFYPCKPDIFAQTYDLIQD